MLVGILWLGRSLAYCIDNGTLHLHYNGLVGTCLHQQIVKALEFMFVTKIEMKKGRTSDGLPRAKRERERDSVVCDVASPFPPDLLLRIQCNRVYY
jgi:hypothetical protein